VGGKKKVVLKYDEIFLSKGDSTTYREKCVWPDGPDGRGGARVKSAGKFNPELWGTGRGKRARTTPELSL